MTIRFRAACKRDLFLLLAALPATERTHFVMIPDRGRLPQVAVWLRLRRLDVSQVKVLMHDLDVAPLMWETLQTSKNLPEEWVLNTSNPANS